MMVFERKHKVQPLIPLTGFHGLPLFASPFSSLRCSVQLKLSAPETPDSALRKPQSIIRPVCLSVPPSPLVSLRPSNLQWPLSGKLLHISSKSYLLFQLSAWRPSSGSFPDPHDQVRHHFPSPPQHPYFPSMDHGVDPTCLWVCLHEGLRLLSGGTTSTRLVHKIAHPTLMSLQHMFLKIYCLHISLFLSYISFYIIFILCLYIIIYNIYIILYIYLFILFHSSQEWNVHQ